jgi:hypothetical protein
MTIRVYRNASTAFLVDVSLAARRHLRRVRSTATDALLRHPTAYDVLPPR